MSRDDLLFYARCFDTAMFTTGIGWPVIWGWPSTVWGWLAWSGLILPLVTSMAWVEYKAHRAIRDARKTRAYRRAKFGGFVNVPNSKRAIPVDRPTPWSDR